MKKTEKIFSLIENNSWSPFFDEADALFGKQTNVQDAHDKYANQEISYLLQRIEEYNGVVLLAYNWDDYIRSCEQKRITKIATH